MMYILFLCSSLCIASAVGGNTFWAGTISWVNPFVPSASGTIFWVNTSLPVQTFSFDFCEVVSCGHTVYVYDFAYTAQGEEQFYVCVTYPRSKWCNYWSDVGWNTGEDWGYRPAEAQRRKDKNGRSLLVRMTLTKGPKPMSRGCGSRGRGCLPLYLNIENPGRGDLGDYVLGVYRGSLTGKLGKIRLKDITERPTVAPPSLKKTPSTKDKLVQEIIPIPNFTWEDAFSIATQTNPRKNLWVEWVRYTVRAANITVGCVACAAANPHLTTIPLNLPNENHTECLLNLLRGNNDSRCPEYLPLLSLKPKGRPPGEIYVYQGNYTCFISNKTIGLRLGIFKEGFCKQISTSDSELLMNLTHALYDVFWLCGDGKLRNKLPNVWRGQCTLVKVIMPFRVLPWDPEGESSSSEPEQLSRKRRSALLTDFQPDPQVYIDAIGVPRGVPDGFKAQDQISAGFQSLIPQIQINKNVDWINYLYYNEQRFVNYSRDAFQGIVEELGPNTRMTLQNRLALDMLLAEKGGVCGMIGEECCTYIPDNTGINGKVTVALNKIKELSKELKTNSGVDTSWASRMTEWAGGWKRLLVTLGMILGGLILAGLVALCCCVPIYRRLMSKVTDVGMILISPQETNPLIKTAEVDLLLIEHPQPPNSIGQEKYQNLQ